MHQEHDGESLTTSTPHWREYPIGAVGEGAQSTLRILAPFGVGIVFTFLLVLVVGITYEEDAIFNALLNLGVTYNDWEPISDLLDYATRMSAFPMLLLAYAIGLAAAVAMCIRDIATSKALVKAARSEEPRIAVPSPAQVESVIKKRFNGLWLLSIYTTGALALFAIIMIIVATTEGYSDFSSIGFLTLGVAALFGALVWFMSAVLHPAHHRRRLIICEWWTTEDEKQAWAAARASARGSEKTTSNSTRVERDPRADRGAKIVKYAGFLFAASIIAIFAIMFVLYPNGSQFHGAGERINLSPGFESLLTIALLVILACATVSLIGMVIGHIVQGAGRRAERHALLKAASDPDSLRTKASLVADYATRSSIQLASVMTALAAALLVAGSTTLILSVTDNEAFEGASSMFAPASSISAIATAVGVLLVIVAWIWNAVAFQRDADLRALLMARWPQLPKHTTESLLNSGGKKRKIPARVGPALTPGTEQDDIV